MQELIDVTKSPVIDVLPILLQDKTTNKNIIWATDAYSKIDEKSEMSVNAILNRPEIICPRVFKSKAEQIARSRKKAEVFTPAWLVNKMNNFLDEDWFKRKNVFNTENNDNTWTSTKDAVEFTEEKTYNDYINSKRLEITCGEAPYLVTRYDAVTGKFIPVKNRVGILDRKIKIVNQNATEPKDWVNLATYAFKSVYGYEYQGDNTLIARINLLMSFVEYYEEKFGIQPKLDIVENIAEIIAKNIWQMDGLKDNKPLGAPYKQYIQPSLFDCNEQTAVDIPSQIFDYEENKYIFFLELKEMKSVGKKLFDYVIGNPPYQEETQTQGDRANPVYNLFMDFSYDISEKVELITPARFLFNAGQTPKSWNKKMLNNPHLKVLHYESDASKVFLNTDIKGGIAITYYDETKNFGSIGTFTSYSELNEIIHKVNDIEQDNPRLNSIIASQGLYKFSDKFFKEHPEIENISGAGTGAKIVSSVMPKLPNVFKSEMFNDAIRILGRIGNKREYRFIDCSYIVDNPYIKKYNLFIPEANNSGQFGETLTEPTLGLPNDGTTDTFLSAGQFDNDIEPKNLSKYMKTKFFRSLLGIKKVTQHCPPAVWEMIPLQDFTKNSDIDWTKSVAEIDRQLYKKYGLNENEIEFIETHVKEMM
ncbi:MAG: Eco57I restriction-modification methylase domain-containing protein [Selenomonadaceae bacterium]|nr:Eco57I restriction-modification methylase domain-containing protein [Selenomonadaceae bacterium]